MKIIIPLAGFGSRLRPHTYSKPKPLINVAGTPVLGHVINMFKDVEVDEFIFITGYMGDQIRGYVSTTYPAPTRNSWNRKGLMDSLQLSF